MARKGSIKKARNVHHNTVLTAVSTAYIQNQDHFIANQVFPTINHKNRSDRFRTYPKEYWFNGGAKLRARHTESAGGSFEYGYDQFYCDVYAYHDDIDRQDREDADAALSLDQDATLFVTQNLLIKREISFAESFLKEGVWGIDESDYIKWSNYATSTPLKDVLDAKSRVLTSTGREPNIMVVSNAVHNMLLLHPDITGRMSTNTDRIGTRAILANYFDVDKYVVGKSIQNTAPQDMTGGFAGDFIMDDCVLLAYAPSVASIRTPSAGLIFNWSGFTGAGAGGTRMKDFFMPEIDSQRIEGEMAYDHKVAAPDCGFFIPQAI